MQNSQVTYSQMPKIPKKKLTLTQLKRFLPLQQPNCLPKLPQQINKYLFSPAFSNLSLAQQKTIKNKYRIVYRNYYAIQDLVAYLDWLTNSKYTQSSIKRAICNCAQRYGVVDWYKIIRIVMKDTQIGLMKLQQKRIDGQNQTKQKQELINRIKGLFKNYKQKKIVWKAIEEVGETMNNLQPKVLGQLIKQAINQVKDFIQKNRISSEQILYSYQKKYQKITFIVLEEIINKQLKMYMDKKKCMYTYLHFDQNNKGYFSPQKMLSQLLVVKKPKTIRIIPEYITDPQTLLEQIRSQFNTIFSTAADLRSQFYNLYYKSIHSESNDPPSPQQQISPKLFYHFLSQQLNDRYSQYQSNLVLNKLQYIGNIHFLYNKPKPLELESILKRFLMKNQSTRKKLKKQNEVFYSFRLIIMHLLSKIKQEKITRQRFTQFIVKIDPKLKYDAFYSVWRVYPSIINIKRMKQLSEVHPFACYVKLRKNEDEYFQAYQQLIDQYPEGTTVMFEKVQEKINLILQFMLQNSKISLGNYSRYDQVDYRETIKEVLQPDFDVKIRKYIFTKVAQKAYAMWINYKKHKQVLNIVQGIRKMMMPSQSKKSLDSKPSITNNLNKSKSKASFLSHKKKIDPQNLQIAQWNLNKIIDELSLVQKFKNRQFHKDKHQRYHLCLNSLQKYVYRTLIPRISLHKLVGVIGISQELLFLKDNHSQSIKTKFLYKPGIQIIDFTINSLNDIILFTSYFNLQFYNLSQQNNYSYRTIQLLDEVSHINYADLEQICQDRVYSKFPIFIRAYGSKVIANTALVNNKIMIIDSELQKRIGTIQITQREHVFKKSTQKIIDAIHHHPKCSQIINSIIQYINQPGAFSEKNLAQVFKSAIEVDEQCGANESLQKITLKERKQFCKNMEKFIPQISSLIIKEQFGLLKARKMPDSLQQVLTTLRSQLQERNISILDMLQTIDRQNNGYVRMKSFKDYLLKITQQVYLVNEKEIDAYLKDMCVGKNVTYEAIIEIVMILDWPYKIWERPRLIIRDFIFQESSNIFIYTAEGEVDVYIRNVEDSKVIGILKDHTRVPQISFIQQAMLLITGDDHSIKLWRLFHDFINKFDEQPPWELSPIYVLNNAHDEFLTSITYLPRANCIATTSVDSTLKVWKINKSNKQLQNMEMFFLEQKIRIYSQQHYFMSSKSILMDVNTSASHKPCLYEKLVVSKINKQINQNNKYKLEMTVQVFHVENIKIQTGLDNIYIDKIPQKLINQIEYFTKDTLGHKKYLLYQKWAKQKQQNIQKVNLVTKSLQRGLYEAVKKYYIFGNQTQLLRIAKFLMKKNDKGVMIYKVLFDQYGLRVIQHKPNAPIIIQNNKQIQQTLKQVQISPIQIPEEDLKQIDKKLNEICKKQGENAEVTYKQLQNVVKNYIFGGNLQKLQSIFEKYASSRNLTIDKVSIKIKDILKNYFHSYGLQSDIDRFYLLLRQLKVTLKNKGIKIWQIFVPRKKQLEKRTKIGSKQFTKKLITYQFTEQQINLILSFLIKNGQISFAQLIYFIKLAEETISIDLNMENTSVVFLKNSKLLKSRLYQFNEEHDPQANKQQTLQDRIKLLENSNNQSGLIRQSSRKSSLKKMKLSGKVSEASSVEQKSVDKNKQRSIPKKSEKNIKSWNVSSSGSRLSLSKQSFTKDSVARQAHKIIKQMKQRFKNQNKSIWQIISLTIPDFMENELITQTEYFNIFKALNSPIYLSQKIKLLNFIQRQSHDSGIHFNILFQLFQNTNLFISKSKSTPSLPGQKYIFSHIVNKLSQNKMKIEHSISQKIFRNNQELTIQQLLDILADQPFNLLNFCLREVQILLILQNKSSFITQQIHSLIMEKINKYNIKVETQDIGYLDELIYRTQLKKQSLQDILSKQIAQNNSGKVNYTVFKTMITKVFQDRQIILQNQFIKLLAKYNQIQQKKNSLKDSSKKATFSPKKKGAASKQSKKNINLTHNQIIKNSEIKYKDFLMTIKNMIEDIKISNDWEKDTLRKFIKCLQSKKMNLLTFFKGLDPNMNYYINQVQFTSGLNQLKINQNFWGNIKKRYTKRLYYNELINYLIEKGVVDYKCVDSQLQAAMSKFIKRFMRNDDIQLVFDRIRAKQSQQPFNSTFQSFNKPLKFGNVFKDNQIFYIFSAFVNAENLKHSKFGNDDIIKDPANKRKNFNFKMFTDTINRYRNQNITKNPLYKLMQWLKKRNISVLNEFMKWMQRNKKTKQIAQALKNKQTSLPKQIFMNFIRDFNSGLSEKQIKQMVSPYKQNIQFSNFNQKLEQIYRKGTSNIMAQEVNNFLQKIYKRIQQLKVSTQRLYKDFTKNTGTMNLLQFFNMISFIELGLTKIQIRQIFEGIDLEKKGYITLQQLQNSLQTAAQAIEREQQNIQFENILQKIFLNRDKISLKASRITFTLDRACLIFSKILTNSETQMLYSQAQDHFKVSDLSEKSLQQYLKIKQSETRAKKDKKYKQLTLKFLNFLKKVNLQVNEAYYYFSKDTNDLTKNKFLILYQSLELKCNIVQINDLYSYLDQNKTGAITLTTWEDKFNMIQFESSAQNDSQTTGAEQSLQVFYKVKLQLSEIYLIFVRKLFRNKQIYAYFNYNGNGTISRQQFINCIANLGVNIDENIETRLLNYLDKQKTGQIQISVIVHQLQNCLASKSKLILETKSSCIFKEKVHLIQQKQQYFIDKLVELEHFIYIKNKLNSAILQTDFMTMIKDFGIILGEDQQNDIERNFKLNKDNLSLYPLYFMFVNIFKSAQFSFSPQQMQQQRFKKLFQAMVKNNITMKIFQKIQTKKQVGNLLTQLKIFTPIEIKLITQKVGIPQTSLIDKNQLAFRIRNSFLSNRLSNITNDFALTFTHISEDEKKRRQLRALIDPTKIVEIMKATSGKVYEDTFVKLLQKIDLILTKKQIRQFFQAISYQRDYLLLQDLLAKPTQQQFLMEQLAPIVSQKNQNLQNPLRLNMITEQKTDQQIYEQNVKILLNHICKQLDFKGISLEQAWQKYYQNFGYISPDSLYKMLDQVGFNYKQEPYKGVVKQLINKIIQQTGQQQIKRQFFQKLMHKYQQYPKKRSEHNKYRVILKIFKQLSQSLMKEGKINKFLDELQKYVLQQTGKVSKIRIHILFGYIQKYLESYRKRTLNQSQNLYVKFICSIIMNKNQDLTQNVISKLKIKLNSYFTHTTTIQTQSDQNDDILIKDPSAALLQTKLTGQVLDNLELIRVCKHNFMWNYQQQVQKLSKRISQIQPASSNLQRVAATILCQQLLSNPYLFQVPFHLSPQQQKSNISSKSSDQAIESPNKNRFLSTNLTNNPSKSINLISMNNIIIQTQEIIPDTGFYIINDKFYAFPTSTASKSNPDKTFDYFSQATTTLHPSFQYFRAKNYYLWQPIKKVMPKTAINYRWKYITNFIVNISSQFKILNDTGFSAPHLKWQGLCLQKGIRELGFVNKLHSNGKYVEDLTHRNLMNLEHPYTAPQFFINMKCYHNKGNTNNLTNKIDVWIFGCLLYEFIWGHSPQSFIIQMFNYVKDRITGIQLLDSLKIDELPSDFHYNPFNFTKINQTLSLQHEFRAFRSPGQDFEANIKYLGYRGIVKQLQIIYGTQIMHYKYQIQLFQRIMKTIVKCLSPYYKDRPSFQDIIQQYQGIMADDEQYRQYLHVLDSHTPTEKSLKDIVNPLFQIFENKTDIIQPKSLKPIVNKLSTTINKCLKNKNIKQIFTIPKQYPWPDQAQLIGYQTQNNQISLLRSNSPMKKLTNKSQFEQSKGSQNFNQTVIRYRPKIRTNINYNIVCFLANEQCFEVLVNLCLRVPQQNKQKNYLFDKVFEILKNMIQSIRTYKCMLVGYIGTILETITQIIFQQQFSFIRKQIVNSQTSSAIQGLRPTKLNQFKISCIQYLKNIIYVNGTGNIQYLPIKQFLQYHPDYAIMFQYFYAAVNLQAPTVHQQYLAINYFIDHLEVDAGDLFWEIIQYFRVPVTILNLFSTVKDTQLLKTILLFLNRLSQQTSQQIPIFKSLPFYIHANKYLDIGFIYPESSTIKSRIIDIISNLIISSNYSVNMLKILCSPSCNTLGNILRLMIEPSTNISSETYGQTALYEQFTQISQSLQNFINIIDKNDKYIKKMNRIEGAQFIIDSFKKNRISLT